MDSEQTALAYLQARLKVRLEIAEAFRSTLRFAYSLAVFGGCTHLVFWRDASGWLYLLAFAMMIFRRGI